MVNQDKLIKQGIKYTDKLFDEISKRLEQGVLSTDTLEAFLEKTKEYTTNNPLVSEGYDSKMLNLILQETNNHKFSRPAQKELVRATIENQVADKIVDVGEDIKESVRGIVKEGYNQGLSQDKIAENISSRISVIKNKRARAIARTEIARAATVSDYIINAERGATHFYVECRNTACPVCKEAWHKEWTIENDDTFVPSEYTAGKKGWIGDKTYPMSDTSKLPPIHPNCRCVPYFIRDDKRADEIRSQIHVKKTEPKQTVDTIFKGTYKTYTTKDRFNGSKVTVREYQNGVKIAINNEMNITHDEIVNHIKSLPEPLRNIEPLSEISVNNHKANVNGATSSGTVGNKKQTRITINGGNFKNKPESEIYDTINHELSHAFGYSKSEKNDRQVVSDKKIYQPIFEADNKLKTYINSETGEEEVIDRWPSGYGKAYYEDNGLFTEDFTESSRLYLNPSTHDKFVKDFPNRAEYLESLYGKPIWDKNSPLYKALKKEGKI